MSRILFLFKYGFKKLLINQLYKKYVKNSILLQKDIEQTFFIRGCKAKYTTVEKNFHHLMNYYPEFSFIFFWRTKRNYRWKSLFTKGYECKIFGSTKIGGGLNCFHPFSTVVNAISIGENFEFRNGLTIGNKYNDNSLLPIIGNNVTVGANVCIIGDIIIGDNVVIGAGAIVVKSVPSNSIVGGNPAKILKKLNE